MRKSTRLTGSIQKAGVMVGIGLVVAVSILAAGLVFIEPTERGIVISALQPRGYRLDVLAPGLHWIIPLVERAHTYSVAYQTYTMSSTPTEGQVQGDDAVEARTKDGQIIFIDASVIYAIDPEKVVDLHVTWQDRYQDNVVRPVTRGTLRDAASQYGVGEIVSAQRPEMEQAITAALTQKFADNDLLLVDFVLRNIRFSDEYAQVVEQKLVAEQQAQQAAYVVQQKEQEAEQARVAAQGQADAAVITARGQSRVTILHAQAEAQALQLISDTLKSNSDLLIYRYIEDLPSDVRVIYLPKSSVTPTPTPSSP